MSEATAVHPSLLQGLGRVVQRWAFVEALEGEFLAFLTGATGGNLYVVTQAVSGRSITAWVRTLADLRFTNENTRDRLSDLFTRIDETRAERNALVHGLWTPGSEPMTATVQTVNLARSALIVDQFVTCPDLNDLIERIGEIISELMMVGTTLGWHKPSSRITLA